MSIYTELKTKKKTENKIAGGSFKVTPELMRKMRAALKADKITLNVFIQTAFEEYLKERKNPHKNGG